MALPTTGAENWGTPLNQYITNVVLAQANAAASSISSHQVAADPHGDRAYALTLVAPLTSGANGPNGFLQLNGAGRVPSSVLPTGGGRTSAFDVVADYGAPTNGTAAATDIQNALTACGAVGGGEVWVGDGNFGIDSTLYVPDNVWLHLSPGAVMTRIVNAGTGQAPVYMVANFNGSVSASGSGTILIEGGSWVFDGQTAAGVPMAFVNGTNILVRNTSIRTLQGSPAILAAGCTGFDTDGISYSMATPVSGRSSYASAPPAVRVETAASSVISGLNAAMYTNSPCSIVRVRNSAITGATTTDGTGPYTGFGGLAGTTAPVSGSYHTDIIVMGNTAVALPYEGVYAANWQTMTVTNNQLNINDGTTASVTWSPSQPSPVNQIVANNGSTDTGSGTYAYKPSSTSRASTTTLTLDPNLQVPVVANAVYEVRASIGYACNSTSAGLAWDFQLPSGSMNYSVNNDYNGGALDGQVYMDSAGTPDWISTFGSGTLPSITVMGLLVVGGSGGTFGLKWAQHSSSSSALTLESLSYLVLTRLA